MPRIDDLFDETGKIELSYIKLESDQIQMLEDIAAQDVKEKDDLHILFEAMARYALYGEDVKVPPYLNIYKNQLLRSLYRCKQVVKQNKANGSKGGKAAAGSHKKKKDNDGTQEAETGADGDADAEDSETPHYTMTKKQFNDLFSHMKNTHHGFSSHVDNILRDDFFDFLKESEWSIGGVRFTGRDDVQYAIAMKFGWNIEEDDDEPAMDARTYDNENYSQSDKWMIFIVCLAQYNGMLEEYDEQTSTRIEEAFYQTVSFFNDLFEEKIYAERMERLENTFCRWAYKELLEKYEDKRRFEQQYPDEPHSKYAFSELTDKVILDHYRRLYPDTAPLPNATAE